MKASSNSTDDHSEIIKHFKFVLNDVLCEYSGIFVFTYIPKYKQFEFIESTVESEISRKDIALIEEKNTELFRIKTSYNKVFLQAGMKFSSKILAVNSIFSK